MRKVDIANLNSLRGLNVKMAARRRLARPAATWPLLLGLDIGGLHQLAAHGKTFPHDGGKLGLCAWRDRKTERGELLLHGIGCEHLHHRLVETRHERRWRGR